MNTLLIEDNISLAQTVVRYLTNSDISCTLRTHGTEGYQEAIDKNYDVIILDIELPGMDGVEICRRLRAEGKSTPIIMLTSRNTKEDTIKGLDYGADDYLGKPCDYRELVARIKALGRRDQSQKSTEILQHGELQINLEDHSVLYNGFGVDLSKREFEVLTYFIQNNERIIPKGELAEKIWNIYDLWADQKVVEVYIGYLRKKLHPEIIVTEKGYGYRLGR